MTGKPETPSPTKRSESSDECVRETPPPAEKLEHSTAVLLNMGTRTPHNTILSNNSSLRALARFVFCSKELPDDWLHKAKCFLFPDGKGGALPNGCTTFTETQLKRLRYYLMEFVVNYRSVKHNSTVHPSTMKGYILGIQRGIREEWEFKLKLLEGPIFADPKEGLVPLIDNHFSVQQASGAMVQSHNILSDADLLKLYSSASLSRSTPKGFQARLVFDIALTTAMRITAMHELTVDQFSKLTKDDELVWVIRHKIGSRTGASKTNAGGLKAVREKPIEVYIWNSSSLDGSLNVFQDIDDYMQIRRGMECNSNRFFLAANVNAKSMHRFFKRQPLGRNSLAKIVGDVCKLEGVTGTGPKDSMTTHGLRATVTSKLLEAGQPDSSVAMRTGHRDLRSLKSYQNLQGKIGKQQHDSIFNFTGALQKHELRVINSTNDETDMPPPAKKIKKEQVNMGAGPLGDLEDQQHVDVNKENIGGGSSTDMDGHAGLRLLSEVQSISGGSFNINVHNHYR